MIITLSSGSGNGTLYGSTITYSVCQTLGNISEDLVTISATPDQESYRTIELYDNEDCTGAAFVGGIRQGYQSQDYNTFDLGRLDNVAAAIRISSGLQVRLYEDDN